MNYRDKYEDVEEAVCDAVPLDLRHVPDAETNEYDAVLEEAVGARPPVLATVPAGTEVEIKTCQLRTGRDQGRGAWVFARAQHERLLDVDGAYLIAVCDGLDVVEWVLVEAEVVDWYLRTRWYEVSTRGYREQAQITWSTIFPPTIEIDLVDVDADPEIVTDGGTELSPEAFRIPTIEELDAMRVDHGLSQRELSRRAGLEEGRFHSILRNDVDPQTETMRAFLGVLQDSEPQTEDDLASKRGPKPAPSSLAARLRAMDPDDLRADGGGQGA